MYGENMTFEAILSSMLDNVPDTVDKREGSIIYDALAPVAAELEKAYVSLDIFADETFADTASLQYLMRRCEERGVPIKNPSAATIEGTFVPSTIVFEGGERFNCGGVNYYVASKIEDGKYSLIAETDGIIGNIASGVLLPIQNIPGLESASITGVLIHGEDGDTTETLRDRYFANVDAAAYGGNKADYIEKVSALAGVGGVKVIPTWNGAGTVKVIVIDSTYDVPTVGLVNGVQTAVDPVESHGEGVGIAPIGHVVTVVGVQAVQLSISANIVFSSGWSWSTAQTQIENVVKDYLFELRQSWHNSDYLTVRVSQIESRILNLSCITDISGLTINSQASNLQLASGEIPMFQEMTVTT